MFDFGSVFVTFFFFNDTATTEIYTLSLHDALPISWRGTTRRLSRWETLGSRCPAGPPVPALPRLCWREIRGRDRKSTRLNSSHANISYAVFCLKKKKQKQPVLRQWLIPMHLLTCYS